MALAERNRKGVIGLMLALTVAAAIWDTPEEVAKPSSSSRKAEEKNKTRPAGALEDVIARFAPIRATEIRAHSEEPVGNLFPSQSWTPKVSPDTLRPSAPALPFTYGGSFREGSDRSVYLVEGTDMHRVKEGDVIKGAYRVEKFEAEQIVLTYLPTGIAQRVPTGGLLP